MFPVTAANKLHSVVYKSIPNEVVDPYSWVPGYSMHVSHHLKAISVVLNGIWIFLKMLLKLRRHAVLLFLTTTGSAVVFVSA